MAVCIALYHQLLDHQYILNKIIHFTYLLIFILLRYYLFTS